MAERFPVLDVSPRRLPGRRVIRRLLLPCLGFLLAGGGLAGRSSSLEPDPDGFFRCEEGGIIRGRTDRREMSLVFTGGDFADGGGHIRRVLSEKRVPAGFFFTGDFYRESRNAGLIRGLIADGHYLGPHSDKHLLYCDWEDRNRTLVTKDAFLADLRANEGAMASFGLRRRTTGFFIPPYEWFNREVAGWAREAGYVLFNFTPGTFSNADYTTPDMPAYLSSAEIWTRIWSRKRLDPDGFNGFILLVHIGTDPKRTDKFYFWLDRLLEEIEAQGYRFIRIDRLLERAISSSGNRPALSADPDGD